MDIWQLGLLISKFGVYLGVSALLGGGWILCITNTDTDTKFTLPASLQTTVTRHMRLFAVIGIIFSAFDFFVSLGSSLNLDTLVCLTPLCERWSRIQRSEMLQKVD